VSSECGRRPLTDSPWSRSSSRPERTFSRAAAGGGEASRAPAPEGVSPPLLGPVSSTMGEILLISMTSSDFPWAALSPNGSSAPSSRRSRCAQVVLIGGETRQFQVLVDPGEAPGLRSRARGRGRRRREVERELRRGSSSRAHGVPGAGPRPRSSVDDLASSVVTVRNSVPILIGNVATVREGPRSSGAMAASTASPRSLPPSRKGRRRIPSR
jgi:hypothetical protein